MTRIIPNSYTEEINCVNVDNYLLQHSLFQSAMSDEMNYLKINNTFHLVVSPKDANNIKIRSVFAVEMDKNNLYIFKASFVTRFLIQI